MADLRSYLKIMREEEASDLFLTVGANPSIKTQGRLQSIDTIILTPEQVQKVAYDIINDQEKIKEFEHHLEMNLAIEEPELGRFRVNIYQQSNHVGIVIRSITTVIPILEDLGLPMILKQLIMAKRGLILVVGATSSGKSTTLASMIDYRNTNQDGHIITIEDPIEFVHHHKKSIISQR